MKTISIILLSLFFFGFISCDSEKNKEKEKISHDFTTIEELDKIASFKFYIFSDNKGDANTTHFNKMIEWTKDRDMKFVIGLGDHLKKGFENTFLGFLENNIDFKNNFYPTIADGENEYYGESQGDWGAGSEFLNLVELNKRTNTQMRENNVEYYSVFKFGEIKIHLITLHYPDEPSDDSVSFKQDSKDYLINTLNSIDKTDKDFVIVTAHSRLGYWHSQLSQSELEIVMNKVDLGLSATTHLFSKFTVENYPDYGTLFINTGAIGYPFLENGEGYIEISFLTNPNEFVLHYVSTTDENLQISTKTKYYVKRISGKFIEY